MSDAINLDPIRRSHAVEVAVWNAPEADHILDAILYLNFDPSHA